MAELTPEEKDWLVKYCMESEENVRLALNIGEIQPDLEAAIVHPFLEELGKEIGAELRSRGMDSYWKPGDIWEHRRQVCFPMTTEDGIELQFFYNGGPREVYVGVSAASTACPEADRVKPYLEEEFRLQTSDGQWFRWWFYPTEDHKSLEDLAMLLDEQVKVEKIAYYKGMMVDSADAIAQALANAEK